MPSTVIPVGFGRAVIQYGTSDVDPTWTLGYKPGTGIDASDAALAIANALKATLSLASASIMAIGLGCDRVDTYQMTGAGLTGGSASVSRSGTATPKPVPDQVAIVVRTGTALLGRQFRGRFYLPSGYVFNDDVESGRQLSSAATANLQSSVTTFLSALTSGVPTIDPYLLHAPPLSGPTPAPTLITSMTVESTLATQRRRLRR